MTSDIVRALVPVVEALEELGVAYRVGGSVVSSALGVPRSTLDVDVVCGLTARDVEAFARRLGADFYVDVDRVREAVARRATFNLIHLETMLKVDVFVKRAGPYDEEVFARVTRKCLEDGTRDFDLTTAEDIILRKLEWFRMGGESSERQWGDVLGVLRVQAGSLDEEYLRRWANPVGVSDLLERALREATQS